MHKATGESTVMCLIATTVKSTTLKRNCNCGTSRRCHAPSGPRHHVHQAPLGTMSFSTSCSCGISTETSKTCLWETCTSLTTGPLTTLPRQNWTMEMSLSSTTRMSTTFDELQLRRNHSFRAVTTAPDVAHQQHAHKLVQELHELQHFCSVWTMKSVVA